LTEYSRKYEPLVKSFLPLSQSPAFNAVIRERLATWKKRGREGGERERERGKDILKERRKRERERVGKGLSSKWSAGNQILFISLRAALLFNDGVGITLWLAVDGKLFTVSLVAMKRESERERERGGGRRARGKTKVARKSESGWYREFNNSAESDAHLAARTRLCIKEERKKTEESGRERRKSKDNLLWPRIKLP